MSIDIDVKTAKSGFWHFPKTFYALLFIEFWERFAFYGLQSVAVIYFIQKYNISEANASNLFSSFSALLYALLIIGGVVGDKILGLRRTYLLGIIVFIIGYGMLSLSHSECELYFSMGMILIGNVFFKTNANNYVGRCFENNDPRLDSAFTYFYMSINIGSFGGIILVPVIAKAFNYNIALSLCSIGMVFALLSYFVFRERFVLSDNQVGKESKNKNIILLGLFVLSILAAYLVGLLLQDLALGKIVLYSAAVLVLCIYLGVATRLHKNEAKSMYIALILLLQAVVFWILYIQTVTSITLFAYHNVNLSFWGYDVPAGVNQAFNPFFIVTLSPLLANLYIYFHKKNNDIGIPTKFALGIGITAFSFIILGIAAQFFADKNSQISVFGLFLAYGFYSTGELLVLALGPSMVAKLLPKRFGGFAQGVWYLTSAVGMKIGGQISSVAADEYSGNNAAQSLITYTHLFYTIGVVVIIVSLVFFIFLKPLNKAMLEVLKHK